MGGLLWRGADGIEMSLPSPPGIHPQHHLTAMVDHRRGCNRVTCYRTRPLVSCSTPTWIYLPSPLAAVPQRDQRVRVWGPHGRRRAGRGRVPSAYLSRDERRDELHLYSMGNIGDWREDIASVRHGGAAYIDWMRWWL